MFLYYYLYYYYRSHSKIILCVASSSITALLLPSSYTAYSYFRIPINLYKESTCNISKSLNLAELLCRTSLLIQDKVLIQYRYCFKAVHCMLTDVRSNNSTFSRLPTILGGNFTQILPIVLRGNRVAIVGAYLQWSFLQPTFRILSLWLNIRVRQGEINQQFAAQVRSLSYNISLASRVGILPSIAQFQSQESFYEYIYPPYLLIQAYYNLDTFYNRAILTIRNNTIAEINEAILTRLCGSLSTSYSMDSVE